MTADVVEAIDWDAARERVAAAQRSIDATFMADPAAHTALLCERARRLATRHARSVAADADEVRVVSFLLDGARYAIDARAVATIGPWQRPRPLPGTPPSLMGLFTARGEIWAMYDLATLLGLEDCTLPDGGNILHLRGWARRAGLRVGQLRGIARLNRSRFSGVPDGTAPRGNFVSGISEEGLIVIDPSALRDHPHFVEGY